MLAVNGVDGAAALDLHYLASNGVAATLCVLDNAVGDEQITPLIEQIDEVLLPEVSRAEGNLHFTVVRGHAIGDFVPHSSAEVRNGE
ncbi:MAG: hypothetical protein ACREHD_05710 [Pirellulales bacterium]